METDKLKPIEDKLIKIQAIKYCNAISENDEDIMKINWNDILIVSDFVWKHRKDGKIPIPNDRNLKLFSDRSNFVEYEEPKVKEGEFIEVRCIKNFINNLGEVIFTSNKDYKVLKTQWESDSNFIDVSDDTGRKIKWYKNRFTLNKILNPVTNKIEDKAGQFPDINKNFGKIIIYGTGEATKLNPKDYFDLYGERTELFKTVSNREKTWYEQMEENSKFYNSKMIDSIGIPSDRFTSKTSLEKAQQLAYAYGIQDTKVPQSLSDELDRLKGIRQHIEFADKYGIIPIDGIKDFADFIISKPRKTGKRWMAKMFEGIYHKLKEYNPSDNIIIPKQVKKEKQIIVHSMKNINL